MRPRRAARGSLNGRWRPNADRRPNLRGVLTIEKPLEAGATLHLEGWTNEVCGVDQPVGGGSNQIGPGARATQ